MNLMNRKLLVFSMAMLSTIGYAQVWLPDIINSDMVLQQQSNVKLWGKAVPNKKVVIKTGWDNLKYETKAASDSLWSIRVATPNASYTPYDVTIKSGETIRLKNVLIGEVWLAGGQSNMEMPLKGYYNQPVENSTEEVLTSNGAIRSYNMTRQSAITPQYHCEGKWLVASPNTLPDFSATGYYFAKYLQQILDVPVAILYCNWGGSSIEAWMSPEAVTPFKNFKLPKTKEELGRLNHSPAGLYHGMIKPIAGYNMRGAIWYQGESNRAQYDQYPEWFAAMHASWKNIWECGDLPIYFCQIAPYYYNESKGTEAALFREAQMKIAQNQQNTGIAILMDSGEEFCIHPANKKVAGQRLAMQALGKSYGFENLQYESPSYKSAEFKEQKAYLTFNEIPLGLSPQFSSIEGFEIAGSDRRFVPAKARLEGAKVVVWSEDVPEPVSVRYLFYNFAVGNLFGTNGLPVSSFRTDSW